jgi:Flp pilus assembly protein TadD
MLLRFLTALVFALLCLTSRAQVPIFEREMPTDPVELKKYLAELEQALKQVQEAPQQEAARQREAARRAAETAELDLAIPDRDDEQIELASKRVVTDQTVVAEINDLVAKLRAGLDSSEVDEVETWLKEFAADPAALASGAAMAWVQRAPGTALLLSAEAAKRAPKDANVLNTLGSLLADAGYGDRGIPLLAYLANKYPDDPTLQNNLGQAWLGLGAPEKAEPRFAACLRLRPGHGAAHASMGVITYCAGNRTAATEHFVKAASSHGSPVARRALRQLDSGYRTPRSFRRLIPVEEHFNPRHFVIPAGQVSLDQAQTKRAELSSFEAVIKENITLAERAMKEAGEALAAKLSAQPDFTYLATLAGGGGAAELALISTDSDGRLRRALKYAEERDAFLRIAESRWADAQAKVQQVRKEFEQRWRPEVIGEGRDNEAFLAASEKLCFDCREIMENALRVQAKLYDDLVAAVSTRERVGVNEDLTYLPIRSGGDMLRQEFYAIVLDYLTRIGSLAALNPIREYTCGPNPALGNFASAEGTLPSPGNCPVNVHVKFAGIKLKADCKSVGLDFKAGLNFSAKKNFQSGETTLKGGVGVEMDLDSLGAVEGSGAFVVVWDRGDSLSFIGVESSASASLSGIPGLSGEMEVEDGVTAGAKLPTGTPDIVKVGSETTLGVTLGPRGVEPTLRGSAGAEVLGRDLVKAGL